MWWANPNRVWNERVSCNRNSSFASGIRRRKSSVDKSQDEADEGGAKQSARDSSESANLSSEIPETNEEKPSVEKSIRKPIAFNQNGGDEQVAKKKRGRKPKTESNDHSAVRFVSHQNFDIKNMSIV